MLKDQIVSMLATKTGLTKGQAAIAYGVFGEVIKLATKSAKTVRVPGLGLFSEKVSPARKGVTPQGGAWVKPRTTVIRFKGR